MLMKQGDTITSLRYNSHSPNNRQSKDALARDAQCNTVRCVACHIDWLPVTKGAQSGLG